MGINMMSLVLGAALLYVAEHWLGVQLPTIPNPLASLIPQAKYAQSYYGYY